jgi:MFS family permease
MMAQLRDERSLGDLFAELARETGTLVRQEVQLAKAELTESATEAGRGIAFLFLGGAVVYAGFLAVLAAVILGLWDAGMEGWQAALLVGVVVAIVGAVLIMRARASLDVSHLAPRRTIATLKEDTEWAKEQIS